MLTNLANPSRLASARRASATGTRSSIMAGSSKAFQSLFDCLRFQNQLQQGFDLLVSHEASLQAKTSELDIFGIPASKLCGDYVVRIGSDDFYLSAIDHRQPSCSAAHPVTREFRGGIVDPVHKEAVFLVKIRSLTEERVDHF